ncbi:MAG: LysR family transcriptional regulator [Pseudomonadota bacterium]
MNWDSLKLILTIARTGSFAAAARQLGVDRTTVLRKIKQIQRDIDFELFRKVRGEYVLTAGAEKILETAELVESHIQSLERVIEGRELRPQGRISVTTTDSIYQFALAEIVASFRRRHPGITVDILLSSQRLSLTRRDADIALRTGSHVPAHLVGYRMGDIDFGVFATQEFMKSESSKSSSEVTWLGVDEPLLSSAPGQWQTNNVNDHQIVLRTNSYVALKTAVLADMGMAILPIRLAALDDRLINVGYDLSSVRIGLWCLTHPDLATSGRVMAFVDFLSEQMGADTS